MHLPRILAIDDEHINLKFLFSVLSKNYTIQTATSGREGLMMAAASPPDLILLDVVMPELDGFETCCLIKANPAIAKAPIVFLTADSQIESQIKGFDVGAADYIPKPIDASLLKRRIRCLLERANLRNALEEERAQLAALVKAIPDLLFTLDSRGTYLNVFTQRPELPERLKNHRPGQTIADILPAEPAACIMAAIAQADADGASYGSQIELQLDDGLHWFELSVGKNLRTNQDNAHFVMLARDITERKEREAATRHLALHDTLTGLANRLLFAEVADRALAVARRNHLLLALVFIDLDRFKSINDTCGHAVGDLVLQQAARRISDCIRDADTVGRIGGDEFVLLLPDLGQGCRAAQVADRIRLALNEPFVLNDRTLSISCSLGIALFPEHGDDLPTLTRHADRAMYFAKEAGRNCVRIFDPTLSSCLRHHARASRTAIEYVCNTDHNQDAAAPVRWLQAPVGREWPLAHLNAEICAFAV